MIHILYHYLQLTKNTGLKSSPMLFVCLIYEEIEVGGSMTNANEINKKRVGPAVHFTLKRL